MGRKKGRTQRAAPRPRAVPTPEPESVERLHELEREPRNGAVLTGGDVDADWVRAASSGEEAVGGSVATPDQDVVDDLGRALGVSQPPDAEVRPAEEILRERDRRYWELERQAADQSNRAEP